MLVLDSTLCIAALDRSRASHRKARELFSSEIAKALTTQTLRETLAVATRPVPANGLGLEFAAAWQALQAMRQACDRVLHESEAWWKAYAILAEEFQPSGRTIYDLGQVAHVRACGPGAMLVTDDAQLCQRYGQAIRAVVLKDLALSGK